MEQKKIIGWGQLLLLLFMCRVFTLMTFVPLIAEGRSLTVQLIAAAISTAVQAVILIPTAVLQRGVTETAVEKNKAAGIFAVILYFVFFLFYTVNSLLHFQNFLNARFFPSAESSVWIGALLIVCVYCGCLGIEALGRSAVLLFWLFVFSLIIMGISSAKDFDTANLSFSIKYSKDLFPAVMDDLARNGEICAAAFLARHVERDLRNHKLRYGIYGLLAAKLAVVSVVSVLIAAVLGEFASLTDYPFLSVGTFGGTGFIQRGDSLYLIVWTVTAVINIALFLHIAGELIGEIFPKAKFRTLISAVLVFAVSLFFTMTGKSFSGIYEMICSGYAVILLAGIIPLIVLIADAANRKGGEKSHA